jgi:hypothetical protein
MVQTLVGGVVWIMMLAEIVPLLPKQVRGGAEGIVDDRRAKKE